MASTYSTSSVVGLVSSNRRLHVPPRSAATPKLRQIDFAWPMWRYPLGSGGNLVATRPWCLPDARSSSTIVRMKSTGRAGVVEPRSSDMAMVHIILVIVTYLRCPGLLTGSMSHRSVFQEEARGALHPRFTRQVELLEGRGVGNRRVQGANDAHRR